MISTMAGLALLAWTADPAMADTAAHTYPAMAPVAQYREASAAAEIALARSAAPPSISADAEVLTLGAQGYDVAEKGKNDFVCVVERSWGADFADPVFWNPKIRGPICFNAVSARTVLPEYLERTRWVLSGMSVPDMIARTHAAYAAHTFTLPGNGAMCFMQSKDQYLSDTGIHWHPHLMFFVANTDPASWGADFKGSPVFAAKGNSDPYTTFFVPVTKWSDGTPAVMEMK
jgi:hypothetical protein